MTYGELTALLNWHGMTLFYVAVVIVKHFEGCTRCHKALTKCLQLSLLIIIYDTCQS